MKSSRLCLGALAAIIVVVGCGKRPEPETKPDPQPVKLDENGIPVLDNPVSADQAADAQAPAAADLTNQELVQRLFEEEAVQQMLDDLTEDLQKMVAWKIESFLQEEICKLIKEATEQSAERQSQDIRTQLQLALPELLSKIAERAND